MDDIDSLKKLVLRLQDSIIQTQNDVMKLTEPDPFATTPQEMINKVSDELKIKMKEMRDALEDKITTDIKQSVEEVTTTRRNCDKKHLQTDQTVTEMKFFVDQLLAQSTKITELSDLRESYPTIMEGLHHHIGEILSIRLEAKFIQMFTQSQELDLVHKELLKLVSGVRQDNESQAREFEKLEQRVESKITKYLLISDFKEVCQQFCSKLELQAVQKQLQPLARSDDVTKQIQKQQEAIKLVSQRISETLATKQDLLKFESKITKYSNDTFISFNDSKRQDLTTKRVIDKLDKFSDSVQPRIEQIEGLIRQLGGNLQSKADKSEINSITCQLGRFALYEDYQALYQKTVPAVSQVQTQMQSTLDQIKTFEFVITQFDENLQLRALKSEMSEFLAAFKTCVKDRVFQQTISDIDNNMNLINQNIHTMNLLITQKQDQITELVRVSCAKVEQRTDIKLRDKLARIPGYQGASLNEQLNTIGPKDNTYQDLYESIKLKADLAEVRQLQMAKTNKTDSQEMQSSIEQIHKMLFTVIVLVQEQARGLLQNKLESEHQKAELQTLLHDKATAAQRWIMAFEPNKQQIKQPLQTVKSVKDQTSVMTARTPRSQHQRTDPNRTIRTKRSQDQGSNLMKLAAKNMENMGGQTFDFLQIVDSPRRSNINGPSNQTVNVTTRRQINFRNSQVNFSPRLDEDSIEEFKTVHQADMRPTFGMPHTASVPLRSGVQIKK